ncbi:MAG: TIGR04282 family arsenosugar biosynthesis glycosyltransferase [Pirellulaceae bacterium]
MNDFGLPPDPDSTLLGMFAKHWAPGKVKTRLAATLGESRAAIVYALFVATLVERFSGVAQRRVIAFSPPEAVSAFRSIAKSHWGVILQAAGDLGARMQSYFESSLGQAERVVLIGSDAPDLPTAYVLEALDALRTCDVVLGPTSDGGYYLVGVARRLPPIFDQMAWSTPALWPQTIARLQQAGVIWHELPTWYDVDDEADLHALSARLSHSPLEGSLVNLRHALRSVSGRRA